MGKSTPGNFLKITAYLSAANIAAATLDGYGRREINRALFKLDNVEAKPGKMWERTKHWTMDDVCIGGGVLGVLLAVNPRALPGVGGWRRFLGAATVGSAVAGNFGTRIFQAGPIMAMLRATEEPIRTSQYERLGHDAKAQKALSRFGRVAFAYYTSPIWSLRVNPFGSATTQSLGRTSTETSGGPSMSSAQNPHAGLTKEEMDKYSLIQIEFNRGELKGPDVEHGYRAYKDTISDRDPVALQDYIEQLREIRQKTSMETLYVWHRLEAKEQKFYSLQADDREVDIARRELQLLNNIASDFASRDAILAYHIDDALKRLKQMKHPVPADNNLVVGMESRQDLPADWMDHFSPQLVAEQVRINWTRQKEMMSMMEQSTALHKDLEPEPGTPQAAQIQQIRESAEMLKKNVTATERLLREFEEQLHRADEYAARPKPESLDT